MVYKPVGVVCSQRGAGHRRVFDLLQEPRRDCLHAVGRLDLDATGLVLLTDDGIWSHALTSPRRKQPKTYQVTLDEELPTDALVRLTQGLRLRGESKPTLPAEVEVVSENTVRLTLREGRYHQVKRMFAAVGCHVVGLHRESLGALHLDPALPPGAYRPLLDSEIKQLVPPVRSAATGMS